MVRLLGISHRQAEVLAVLLTGMTEAKAAEMLYVSPATIHDHARRLYRHFGVSNRTALAVRVMQKLARTT